MSCGGRAREPSSLPSPHTPLPTRISFWEAGAIGPGFPVHKPVSHFFLRSTSPCSWKAFD
jgi:hypothetical protein